MESTIVTVNDLKNFSSIGANVDPELLYPHLLIAQQLYLQPVLGDALYDDIVSRFDNNWLTGNTQTLYEQYIIPALAYSSWYSVAPFLNYKTQRAGLQTTASPDSTPLTPEEMTTYLGKVNNFKDFYLSRLEKYLVTNKTLFPLFRQNDVRESNGSSIYLGYKTTEKWPAYWGKTNYGRDII